MGNVPAREEEPVQTDAPTTPRYITYRQAQEMYSLSRTTMWRMIKDPSSGVRAARVGRAVRIEVASLERALGRRTVAR